MKKWGNAMIKLWNWKELKGTEIAGEEEKA